jgi:histidine decarboxylase
MVFDNCIDPYNSSASHMRNQTEKHELMLVQELAKPWIKSTVLDNITYVTSQGKQISSNLWGYIATGGTEGVFKGLVTGIQLLHKRKIVLYTSDAHFSIIKAIRTCEQDSIKIKSKNNGVMNLDDLESVLQIIKRAGYEQVILMPTLGTTFKGACDDIEGVLTRTLKFYNRDDIYIHLDAAFFGGYWHHLDDAPQYYLGEHFDSISISGHKFYGGFIAACFFTNRKVESSPAEYLNSDDKELMGSKNGFNPLLWRARLRQFDWKEEYFRSRRNLKLLEEGLRRLNIPCYSHPHSLITIFPEPSNAVSDKFQLATLKGWAHVCLMPHISEADIKDFLDALISSGDATKMAREGESKSDVDETGWPSGVVS